eukprot:Blabericola_migrator_1__273@NODE_1070_length_5536_cov_34_507040_g232_i1_p1_GENE_NODE_1070_length_5536_cov_34_507040_g232_i1NODE_1070_length_5536_cov_34_507040_g232_i1_p1_ORF_typecomplete_len749_score89_51_NODE_1070_length_5536_cov_34_507040_g232_i18113057
MKAPVVSTSALRIPRTVLSVLLSISTPHLPENVSHPGELTSGAQSVMLDRLSGTYHEGPSNPKTDGAVEERLGAYSESKVVSAPDTWPAAHPLPKRLVLNECVASDVSQHLLGKRLSSYGSHLMTQTSPSCESHLMTQTSPSCESHLMTQTSPLREESKIMIQSSDYEDRVQEMPAQSAELSQTCLLSTKPMSPTTKRSNLVMRHRQKADKVPGSEKPNIMINLGTSSHHAAVTRSVTSEGISAERQLTDDAQATKPPPSQSLLDWAQMIPGTMSAPKTQSQSRQEFDQMKRKAESQPHRGKFHRTSAETTLAAISQSTENGTGEGEPQEVRHAGLLSEVIAELLKSKDASILYVRPPVSPDVPSISEAGAKVLAAAEAIVERSTSQFEPHSFSLPAMYQFESVPTTYGSPAWLLQMYLTYRREEPNILKNMFRNCSGDVEIQTALALHGFPNVDVSGLFRRAHTIVGYLGLTSDNLLTIKDEQIRQAALNDPDVAGHAMAAELIHAAFLTKPFIRNIPAYIAEHNNQATHADLIDDITNARLSISCRQQARARNSEKLIRQDWLTLRNLHHMLWKRPCHPFSFPQFLRDIDLIFRGEGASACSKYNEIFSIDFVSELQRLLDTYTIHSVPLAFAQGLRHGFVPRRYARFYIPKTPNKTSFTFTANSQALAGALVLMYKDLILRSGLCVQDLEAKIRRSMTPKEGHMRLAEMDELLQADEVSENVVHFPTPASKPPLTRLQRYLLEGQ